MLLVIACFALLVVLAPAVVDFTLFSLRIVGFVLLVALLLSLAEGGYLPWPRFCLGACP